MSKFRRIVYETVDEDFKSASKSVATAAKKVGQSVAGAAKKVGSAVAGAAKKAVTSKPKVARPQTAQPKVDLDAYAKKYRDHLNKVSQSAGKGYSDLKQLHKDLEDGKPIVI